MTIRNYTAAHHGGVECQEVNASKEEECNHQACPVTKFKGGTQRQGAVLTMILCFALMILQGEA